MVYDRSYAKRQRIEPSDQDHMGYHHSAPLHSAQPRYNEQISANWTSFSANVNVETPVSQIPGTTTAVECSVAIRVNGQPYDSTSAIHSTSHFTFHHQNQNALNSTYSQGTVDKGVSNSTLALPNGNVQLSPSKSVIEDETQVCYGMVTLHL
jgi:hypothetical protein